MLETQPTIKKVVNDTVEFNLEDSDTEKMTSRQQQSSTLKAPVPSFEVSDKEKNNLLQHFLTQQLKILQID